MLVKIAFGAAIVAGVAAAAYFSGVVSETPATKKKVAESEARVKEARAKTEAVKANAKQQMQITNEKREQDQRDHSIAMAAIHA